MASLPPFFLTYCFLLLLFTSPSIAKKPSHPHALVVPVSKDPSTLQYIAQIKQRTPLVPLKLTLDLGGQFLWVDCEKGYKSSTYKTIHCGTPQCSFKNPKPGCLSKNKTCYLESQNYIGGVFTFSDLSQDVIVVQSTDGSNPGRVVSVPNFLFACSRYSGIGGLASGVKGIAGLGRTSISPYIQFSNAFGIAKKFAICFGNTGVMFFGDGPYILLPGIDLSKRNLIHTPLILNPKSAAPQATKHEPSSEYFIGVTSIKFSGKEIPLNKSLLSINKEGYGGTKISTIVPYTVMETSIYKAVVGTVVKAMSGIPRVASVAPFEACYSSKSFGSTILGPGMPSVDLVLHNASAVWSIFGANSMVQVKSDVLCFGFVDGGESPRTSIVIGAHQLHDNFLEFDLAKKRLGIGGLLYGLRTTCSNFNFTTKA